MFHKRKKKLGKDLVVFDVHVVKTSYALTSFGKNPKRSDNALGVLLPINFKLLIIVSKMMDD